MTIIMIRKAALQIGMPALLAVICWNAYLGVHHLRETRQTATLMVESSTIQTNISAVLQDLTDMEASQRGYLLAGDTSYLQPYTEAKTKIGKDFADLHAGLAKRGQQQQAFESRLESLAGSRQAEMERGIDLRQRGYRHRAFKLVDTNEGKEYMDQIRGVASAMTSLERGGFTNLSTTRDAASTKALSV